MTANERTSLISADKLVNSAPVNVNDLDYFSDAESEDSLKHALVSLQLFEKKKKKKKKDQSQIAKKGGFRAVSVACVIVCVRNFDNHLPQFLRKRALLSVTL